MFVCVFGMWPDEGLATHSFELASLMGQGIRVWVLTSDGGSWARLDAHLFEFGPDHFFIEVKMQAIYYSIFFGGGVIRSHNQHQRSQINLEGATSYE